MEVFSMLTLSALVTKIVAVLKAVKSDVNFAVTQALTWGVGVALTFLAGASDLASKITPFEGAGTLSNLNGPSKVLAGLALSSAISVVYDFKKAIDGTDSAKEPRLTKL